MGREVVFPLPSREVRVYYRWHLTEQQFEALVQYAQFCGIPVAGRAKTDVVAEMFISRGRQAAHEATTWAAVIQGGRGCRADDQEQGGLKDGE